MLWSSCLDIFQPTKEEMQKNRSDLKSTLQLRNLYISNNFLPIETYEKFFEFFPEIGINSTNLLKEKIEEIISKSSENHSKIKDTYELLCNNNSKIKDSLENVGDLFSTNLFMTVLTELTEIKIKIWSVSNENLLCQKYGKSKQNILNFLHKNNKLIFLEKIKNNLKKLNENSSTDTSLGENSPLKFNEVYKNLSPKNFCLKQNLTIEDNYKKSKSHKFNSTVFDDLSFEYLEEIPKKEKSKDKIKKFIPKKTFKPKKKEIVNLTNWNQKPEFCKNIISADNESKNGKLKFFSKEQEFGFIVDNKGDEIFVHKDDLIKAKINPDILINEKKIYDIYFSYKSIQYQGKKKISRKAVDLKVTGYQALIHLTN